MALLKFKAFEKLRRDIKEKKIKENETLKFKAAFTENLSKYKAKDVADLDEDQLAEFLESMKSYRSKK